MEIVVVGVVVIVVAVVMASVNMIYRTMFSAPRSECWIEHVQTQRRVIFVQVDVFTLIKHVVVVIVAVIVLVVVFEVNGIRSQS